MWHYKHESRGIRGSNCIRDVYKVRDQRNEKTGVIMPADRQSVRAVYVGYYFVRHATARFSPLARASIARTALFSQVYYKHR